MHINVKKVTALPLDQLYLEYTKNVSIMKADLEKQALDEYKQTLANKTAREYINREDSFEGDNEEEILRFTGTSKAALTASTATIRKETVSKFCSMNSLRNCVSWLFPQISSIVAEMPLIRTPEGKINSAEYGKQFGKDDWHKGLWLLCTHSLRGDLMSKQYSPENRNYSALVPLLLMPHKRFNNVKYSEWDEKGLEMIVDPNLHKAMTYSTDLVLSKDEILEFQKEGLLIRSGAKSGQHRSPLTTHKLYGLQGSMCSMPWLAQVMLFQVWCAHPANRGDGMILDWKDWDSMPEPLISTDIFMPKEKPIPIKKKPISEDLPWD